MKAFLLRFLSVWALLWSLSSTATQFMPLSIEEIAGQSDVIVHGLVQSKTWARDAQGAIFTTVNLSVSDTWKGRSQTNVAIVLSGGILGDDGIMVSGQADYDVGEEVVAFLVLNARKEAVTLGPAHGKFHVWKDPISGEKFAQSLFHGAGQPRGRTSNKVGQEGLKVSELKRRALGRKP